MPHEFALPASPRRRATRAVQVGDLLIGGGHPILIQSMVIADTMHTEAVVAEIRALVEAGCPLVRVTAPSLYDAENLVEIRKRLHADGIRVPMVADIHFTPNAALRAAEIVEKVRINPGNYADRKKFAVREYSDAEYESELERLREKFRPLVRRCKETGCAMRIGTNHGSLSDRIMNRYGDTPEGMVESALEFVHICEDEGYREIVLSMKSSVTSVMIAAYRRLVERMMELGMDYPLHLGVTEAGDGLEARIKSAIGIGSLLADGLGDTIRVSLTEDSVHELPAARAILDAVTREVGPARCDPPDRLGGNAWHAARPSPSAIHTRRPSTPWPLRSLVLGGDAPVRVERSVDATGLDLADFADLAMAPRPDDAPRAELISLRPSAQNAETAGRDLRRARAAVGTTVPLILEWTLAGAAELETLDSLWAEFDALSVRLGVASAAGTTFDDVVRDLARRAAEERRPLRFRVGDDPSVAVRYSDLCRSVGHDLLGFVLEPGALWIARLRALTASLASRADLLFLEVPFPGADGAILAGSALTDGIGDVLSLLPSALPAWPPSERAWMEDRTDSAYAILQACRLRLTRAEFIACPSCGRTQFDLQTTTARIKARTSHLKGVKIAIMGCIVNGPGEMADADFGYVGAGVGKIDLYVGKERVRQNVPEIEAEARLVELIAASGKWIEAPGGRV